MSKNVWWPLLIFAAGCLHTPQYDRAFTQDWAHSVDKEREMQSRKDYIAGKKRALVGKDDGARAAIEMDEKGRPKLNVGKKSGLSADVDMHGLEPDVKIKYGFRW